MSIEQIEMAGVATEKSYRRLADWVIALVLVTLAGVIVAALLVQTTSPRDEVATASFSTEAAGQSRALNEPVLNAQAAGATFTLSGVLDSRGLNEVAGSSDRYLNALAASTDRYMAAARAYGARNEVETGAALSLTGIEDGRALNTPAATYRFMAGPGR